MGSAERVVTSRNGLRDALRDPLRDASRDALRDASRDALRDASRDDRAAAISEDDELDDGTVRAYTTRALDVYTALFHALAADAAARVPECDRACFLARAERIESVRGADDAITTLVLRKLLAESFHFDRDVLMAVPAIGDRGSACL